MTDVYNSTSDVTGPATTTPAQVSASIAAVLTRLPASAVTRLIDALPVDLQAALAARIRQFDNGLGLTRRKPRRRVGRPAMMTFNEGANFAECLVIDITDEGCRIRVDDAYAVPRFFSLQVQGEAQRTSCGVRWRASTELGVKFVRE
jgi:hypothetical protein